MKQSQDTELDRAVESRSGRFPKKSPFRLDNGATYAI